ncbi:DciA family protein [Bullifex porci]|nr:DciA family protein [Bullifex porci]MDD7254586.1 DciA family protein [Bullifex porci]MDD7588476.1 DciA family protein [Bullifex porci]MDY2741805.1 DciA family protein [Bullifex porci]
MKYEVPIGYYVKSFQKKVEESLGEEVVVFKWKEIVGPALYPHVMLDTIDVENLEVSIDHPAYKSAFILRQNLILNKIKELFPRYDIKNVKIHLV